MTTPARKTASPAKKTTGRPPVAPKPVRTPSSPSASLLEPTEEKTTTHLIHFLHDGFTAFGTVWRSGQELQIVEPSADFSRTVDANGKSWLSMTDSEQLSQWGKIMFGRGPSSVANSVINYRVMPGDGTDLSGRPKYSGYLSRPESEAAAKAETERGRSVPTN